MGVWSTIEGNVSFRKDNHFSLEKAVKTFIQSNEDEYFLKIDNYKENRNNIISANLYLSVDGGGLEIAKFFQDLANYLRNQNCRAELQATIDYRI